jgi:hypothetical protein
MPRCWWPGYIISYLKPVELCPGACELVSRVDSESRFAIFLARILWKRRLASRENINASLASLTSLARRENCDMLSSLWVSHLRDSQTSKVIIHNEKLVLDSEFSQDSLKTPVTISNDSCESRYEISFARLASLATKFVCETREKRVLLQNFFLLDS